MAAGDILPASRTLAERTSSGSTFTSSEAQLDSIAAPLVNGRRYCVVWVMHMSNSAAGESVSLRVREDTSGGTNIQSMTVPLPAASTTYTFRMETEYVAVATGTKTFVFTGQRGAGSGTITPFANTTSQRVRMYVEQVPG